MIQDNKKYNLENLPIRDEVKQQIKDGKLSEMASIDLIHTVGRMLSLQDNANEEQFDTLFKGMCSINKKLDKLVRSLAKINKVIGETQEEMENIKNTG